MDIYILLIKQKFKDYWMDKMDIFAGLTSSIAYTIATLISFDVIFKNTDNVGGFTKDYFVMLFAISQLVIGIIGAFITPMGVELYEEYTSLNLDPLLTRPVSIIGHLLFMECDFNGFSITLIGVYLLTTINVNVAFINIVFGGTLLIMATIMMFSLFLTLSSLSCLIRSDTLTTFLSKTSDIFRYPFTIFPKFIQIMIIYLIPVGLVCYVPVKAMEGDLDISILIEFLITFLITVVLSKYVFKYAIYKYQQG